MRQSSLELTVAQEHAQERVFSRHGAGHWVLPLHPTPKHSWARPRLPARPTKAGIPLTKMGASISHKKEEGEKGGVGT